MSRISQNHYSLLYREEEREMNRFCNATGVAIVPVRLSVISLSATDVG